MARKKLTRADKTKRLLVSAQKLQGYTQKDIGKIFGVQRQTVAAWFADIDNVKLSTVRRLLKLLGVSMTELEEIEG